MKIRMVLFFTGIVLLSLNAVAANSSTASIEAGTSAIVSSPPGDLKDQYRILQMRRFATMTISDYEKLKGKKLNAFEKLSFRLTKSRVNKMLKAYDYGDGPTTLQKISWLLKGLLLGPIALLLGYLFLKDEERELIKWIWYGFAGMLVGIGIILLTL